MNGNVFGHKAILPVTMRLHGSSALQIDFVIDTGFIGFLTMPAAAIAVLGLPYSHDIIANLADNTVIKVDVHIMTILWHGQELIVEVLAMGKSPLIGTALLLGNNLNVDFVDNGLLAVTPVAVPGKSNSD